MCLCDVHIRARVTEQDTCGGQRTDSWAEMVLSFHYRIPRGIKLRLLGLDSKLYLLSPSAGPRTSVYCILDSTCLHVFTIAARFPNIWWENATDSPDRTPQQSNCFDGVLVEMPLAFRKSHPHILFGNFYVALGNSSSLGNCFKPHLLCAFSELSILFPATANSPLHCGTSTCKPLSF